MRWRLKARRGVLFDNWLILTREGEPLCRASQRKVNFYLRNNLAEYVGDKQIRLTFEPNGPGDKGNAYMLLPRANHCAVCGVTERLTKHHIVPYCYRRWFPNRLGSRNSYDVVALCVDCHERYEQLAHQRRCEIAAALNIPKPGAPVEDVSEEDRTRGKAIRSASALDRHARVIPPEKREQLWERIDTYLGRTATWSEAHELAQQVVRTSIRHAAHGQLVVQSIEDLDAFARGWREHFIATMKPRHLSPLYAVDAPVKRVDRVVA